MSRITDDVLGGDPLLTPAKVAALFGVNPKQPARWARAGLISSVRTPGGHRRFRASEIHALLHRAVVNTEAT